LRAPAEEAIQPGPAFALLAPLAVLDAQTLERPPDDRPSEREDDCGHSVSLA
jgi:hypothetical protein